MVFPSPVGKGGSDDSPGYWGAIIVNPTNQTLIVNRVVIMLATAIGGSNLVIDANQYLQHIHPITNSSGTITEVGLWCIPEDNMMSWSAQSGTCANPTFADSELIRIDPVDAREFVLKVRSTSAGDNDGMMVAGNTYTSSGQFTKITHSASAIFTTAAVTVVNVYPTPKDVTATGITGDFDADPPDPNADDSLFEGVKDAGINDVCTFYITVREAQESTTEYIEGVANGGNAHLIINLPTGFPNLSADDNQEGFGAVTTRVYSDGAKQIAVPIKDDLGDSADVERITFKFVVTTPELDAPRMYIFYAFVNGTDVDDNPLGPVSEAVVLRVDPTNGSDFCEG